MRPIGIAYGLRISATLILTYRVISSRGKDRPVQTADQSPIQSSDSHASEVNSHSSDTKRDYRLEESAVTLMALLCVPHLLIYDLVILLIPIGHLFGFSRDYPEIFPAWPPTLLYVLAMIAPIYPTVPGFSVIPCAMLFTQVMLARRSDLV